MQRNSVDLNKLVLDDATKVRDLSFKDIRAAINTSYNQLPLAIVSSRPAIQYAPPLQESNVQSLWEYMFTIRLDKWWHEFTPHHVRNPYHASLVGVLDAQMLIKFDLLTIWYLYSTKVAAILSGHHTDGSIKTVFAKFKDYANSRIKDRAGLEEYLPLIALLHSETKSKAALDSYSQVDSQFLSFRQELATYFVPDRALRLNDTQFELLVDDVLTYIRKYFSPMTKLENESTTEVYWRFFTIFKSAKERRQMLVQKALTVESPEEKPTFYYPHLLYYNYKKGAKKNSLVEDVVFFSMFQIYSTNGELDLKGACELYQAKDTDYLTQAAAASVILHELAQLLSTTKTEAEFEAAIIEHAEIIKQVLAAGNQHPPLEDALRNSRNLAVNNLAGLFLLHLVPQEQLFSSVLTPEKLRLIGLEDWSLKSCPDNYPYFPFMLDEQNKSLGKAYVETYKLLQESADQMLGIMKREFAATAEDGVDALRSRYKMLIALVCYYYYYNRLQGCRTVLHLLKNYEFTDLLKISAKEKVVLKMLASEPHRMERCGNPLLYLFSYQARERLEDYSLANIMVNAIAIALGSPPNSNHIYSYTFDFGNSGKCAPGSKVEGKKKVDTGYPSLAEKQRGSNNLDTQSPERLALCTLVWIALGWSCIIEPPKHSVYSSFMVDLWGKLGFFEKMSPESHIVTSIAKRAQHYFTELCNHPVFKEQRINGLHFLTEALWKMWEEINVDKKTDAWAGVFDSETAAQSYEEELEKIFSWTIDNYKLLKGKNRLAHNDNKHARNIVDLQVHQRERFYTPLLPFAAFTQYIQENTKDQEANINHIKFLRMFISHLDKLHVLKHISTLVSFYHYLNKNMAKRVNYATSPDIEFPACLADKLTEAEDSAQWTKFSEAWAEIMHHFKDKTDVEPHKPSISLIKLIDNSQYERGLVYNLIQKLVFYQDYLLQKEVPKFKPGFIPKKLQLYQIESFLAHELIILGGYTKSEFEHLMMSQLQLDEEFNARSLKFDILRVTELIWDKAINGKVVFLITEFFEKFEPADTRLPSLSLPTLDQADPLNSPKDMWRYAGGTQEVPEPSAASVPQHHTPEHQKFISSAPEFLEAYPQGHANFAAGAQEIPQPIAFAHHQVQREKFAGSAPEITDYGYHNTQGLEKSVSSPNISFPSHIPSLKAPLKAVETRENYVRDRRSMSVTDEYPPEIIPSLNPQTYNQAQRQEKFARDAPEITEHGYHNTQGLEKSVSSPIISFPSHVPSLKAPLSAVETRENNTRERRSMSVTDEYPPEIIPSLNPHPPHYNLPIHKPRIIKTPSQDFHTDSSKSPQNPPVSHGPEAPSPSLRRSSSVNLTRSPPLTNAQNPTKPRPFSPLSPESSYTLRRTDSMENHFVPISPTHASIIQKNRSFSPIALDDTSLSHSPNHPTLNRPFSPPTTEVPFSSHIHSEHTQKPVSAYPGTQNHPVSPRAESAHRRHNSEIPSAKNLQAQNFPNSPRADAPSYSHRRTNSEIPSAYAHNSPRVHDQSLDHDHPPAKDFPPATQNPISPRAAGAHVVHRRTNSVEALKHTVKFIGFSTQIPDFKLRLSRSVTVSTIIDQIKKTKVRNSPFYLMNDEEYMDPNAHLTNDTQLFCYPGAIYKISFSFSDPSPDMESLELQTYSFPPSVSTSRLFAKASEIFSLPLDQTSLFWEAANILRSSEETVRDLFGACAEPRLEVRAEISVKLIFMKESPADSLFGQTNVIEMDGYKIYVEGHAADCVIRMDACTPLHLFWTATDSLFPNMVAIAPTGWSERPKLGTPIPKQGQTVLNLRIKQQPIVVEIYPEEDVQFVTIKVNNAESSMYVLPEITVYDLMLRAIGEIEMSKYYFEFPDLVPGIKARDKLGLPISSFAQGHEDILRFCAYVRECRVVEVYVANQEADHPEKEGEGGGGEEGEKKKGGGGYIRKEGEEEFLVKYREEELTLDYLLESLAEHRVACDGKLLCTESGFLLDDIELLRYVKSRQRLLLVPESDLISIFVQVENKEEISCRVLLSTTPADLSISLDLPQHLFFAQNLLIPADQALGGTFGVEEEEGGGGKVMELKAEDVNSCKKIDKKMRINEKEIQLSILPGTPLTTIAEFAKFTFKIDPETEVEIQDSEECYDPNINFVDEFSDEIFNILAYKPQ